jgi:lysophospholipase L1-like esterase
VIVVPSVLKNALLFIVVAFVSLLALEPLTRLFLDSGKLYELEMWKYATEVKVRDVRPDIGHRHRPNAHAILMGEDVRTNAFGFRGPEIAEKAAPGVARIAFVGDSIALGWGVAEQDTFSSQVVAMLKAQGRKVDGYNLGVGNYNTQQELALFRDVGARLKPDVIVLCYFINDAEPMPTYDTSSWLEENSAARVVLNYRLDSLRRQFGVQPDWKHYYRNLYEPSAPGWIKTQQSLAGFAAMAREMGVPLVVFNIPELRELKPYPFADVTAKVRAVVESQKVPFVDLLPAVENLEPASLWVTVPDPHPNGKADIALSKAMVPEIVPLLDSLCRSQSKGCREMP